MTDLLTATMARVVRADIQGLHAYAVQPSAGMVKVDTMENPHPLPPALQQALGERLGRVAIHRYPAERGDDLKAALAAHAGLPAGCSLMLGNGSDELITLLSMACALPGAVFMSPLPSFVMYGLSAALQGVQLRRRAADFGLRPGRSRHAGRHRPAQASCAVPGLPQQPHRQPVG
jgi:histidinol-phosphate aminotransferase